MTQPNQTSWGGHWSDKKLQALSKYLKAYTTALQNTPFKLHYIDAFAGAGAQKIEPEDAENVEAEERYRHGSPLVALATEPPFHQFTFIEENAVALASLKEQIQTQFPSAVVDYLNEDANQALARLCAQDWIRSNRRAVVFLDPFAVHVRWETIRRIAQTKAMDMWLLFPAMAINRMLPISGNIPDAWRAKLSETFGNDEWEKAFYRNEGLDLFNDTIISKKTQIFEKLSVFVTGRLKSEFSAVVEKPLILKTPQGAPLFLLCFAAGNPKGAPIAKRIAAHILDSET